MLIKPENIIAVFTILVMLFGCSVTPPTPKEQTQVTEPKQKDVPTYLPCIQGPETLRSLPGAGDHTFKGNNARRFFDRLPPLTRQHIIEQLDKCASEAEAMNGETTCNLEMKLHVEVAEEFIVDCSDQLARLSAASAIADSKAIKAMVQLWQSNLEFMKWWLFNFHQKYPSYDTSR